MNISDIKTPAFVVYEERLRNNLELICSVKKQAGINIIMAFKANALWRTFPIIKEYIKDSTASSLNEMKLGREFLGGNVHTYCPAYTDESITILKGSSHITFNSLGQHKRFEGTVLSYNNWNPEKKVSMGLRVNPQCSVIETDIYNPALPGSRFGVTAEEIGCNLPETIEGLHFPCIVRVYIVRFEKGARRFRMPVRTFATANKMGKYGWRPPYDKTGI